MFTTTKQYSVICKLCFNEIVSICILLFYLTIMDIHREKSGRIHAKIFTLVVFEVGGLENVLFLCYSWFYGLKCFLQGCVIVYNQEIQKIF